MVLVSLFLNILLFLPIVAQLSRFRFLLSKYRAKVVDVLILDMPYFGGYHRVTFKCKVEIGNKRKSMDISAFVAAKDLCRMNMRYFDAEHGMTDVFLLFVFGVCVNSIIETPGIKRGDLQVGLIPLFIMTPIVIFLYVYYVVC